MIKIENFFQVKRVVYCRWLAQVDQGGLPKVWVDWSLFLLVFPSYGKFMKMKSINNLIIT